MTAVRPIGSTDFRVVTAEDADGGLRLSLIGAADDAALDLRDVVIAALRSEPPRVEIDLRDLDAIDPGGATFLLACRRLAELLGVEYRLSRPRGAVAVALAGDDVVGDSGDEPRGGPCSRLDPRRRARAFGVLTTTLVDGEGPAMR